MIRLKIIEDSESNIKFDEITDDSIKFEENNNINEKIDDSIIRAKIGSCISKINGSISKSLLSVYSEILLNIDFDKNNLPPCQMFLRNKMGQGESDKNDIDEAHKLIKNFNILYFTHSVYIINLSRPVTKKNPNSEEWILGLLTKDLQTTAAIGGKGVVVHVGKEVGIGKSIALDKMESSVKKVLKYATDETPLLLETPAGEGTELCSTIEELSLFYSRFDSIERQKFKICVDTCHVFASGYDPLDYMISWENLYPKSIAFVHFNDSKNQKGSHVDLHKHYMLKFGFIGYQRMIEIAEWCISKNIPMVTE